MEDNIKKFEGFLDRMQGLLDNAKKQGHIIVRVEDLENAFPELKESEDEKVRKSLISGMENLNFISETFASIPIKDVIGWLEKQGEQKSMWTDEDEELLQHCCGAVAAADYYTLEDKEEMENWLKSLKQRME